MHIMFMAQCYAPEDVSAAVLITELATDLAKRGHRHHDGDRGTKLPGRRVFEGYRNRLYSAEMLDGVRVIRTWSYISPAKKTVPRLLHYGSYSATAFYGGLFGGKNRIAGELLPPLPLRAFSLVAQPTLACAVVLQIEDLYPTRLVAAG